MNKDQIDKQSNLLPVPHFSVVRFLASAKNYVPIGAEVSMGVVKQLVLMAHGERSIFIGYQDLSGTITLMPEHNETKYFDEDERLVIFKRILV